MLAINEPSCKGICGIAKKSVSILAQLGCSFYTPGYGVSILLETWAQPYRDGHDGNFLLQCRVTSC